MKQVQYKVHTQKGVLLNANESSNNLSVSIRKEIQEAVFDIEWNRYPDDRCQKLCEAYAKWIHVPADQILAGNGSDQHLGFLIGTFLGKDKKLLTLAPDFGMYDYYASNYDAQIVRYELDPLQPMDVDAFIRFGQKEDPQMVLFSNPNNPTGQYLDNEQIKKICQAFHCPVVIDEAYAEFAPGSCLSLLEVCQNLYVTRTLSKAFSLAGARIGFLITSLENMEKIRDDHVPYSVNSISMKAAEIVLNHADEFTSEIKRIKQERDAFLSRSYTSFSLSRSHANFLLIYTSNIDRLLDLFEQKGLSIRRYEQKNYCRVTIGTTQENQWIKDVLDTFEKEEAYAHQ